MASIRQRGIYWEARVRRDGWPTISRSFNTKTDARAWATVIESEMERGVFIDRTEAEKNTLGDLFQRYLTEVSSQKKGYDSERYRLISLQNDPIAKFKVAGLSGKLMAEWRDRRLKEVSGSTTNRDLNLISHVINVARKEWGIHIDNPISMIRRPAENRARSRRLGIGEEEKLLAELEESTRSEHGTFKEGGSRNEFGGTEGIVTISDLFQTMAGNMMPGADDPAMALAVQREDGSWLLDGLLPIDELVEKLGLGGISDPQGLYHTVGGFVVAHMGKIPKRAEKFRYGDWEFEVVDMDHNRVDEVLATRLES